MEIKNINDLMNEALQAEFCRQEGLDGLTIYNDHVVGYKTECIESYYGHCLFQDVIAGEYSYEEIQRWIDKEYEKEAALCNADAFYGV